MIYLVEKTPLIPQDKTNGCWYFGAKMMSKWASDAGKPAIKDPATLTDLFNLYDCNCGYALSTCKTLAEKLGMKALSRGKRSFEEYHDLLRNGPLWAAGIKGGVENSPHVVVLAGVADTGVLVLDPLPLDKGNREWKTWKWLDSFLVHESGGFDANLLAPK